MIADQLAAIGVSPRAIMLEPAGRNTAAAIGLAAHQVVAKPTIRRRCCWSCRRTMSSPTQRRSAPRSTTARAAALDGCLDHLRHRRDAYPETGFGLYRAGCSASAGRPGVMMVSALRREARRSPPPKAMSPAGGISGTAASSCSPRNATSTRWRCTRPTSPPASMPAMAGATTDGSFVRPATATRSRAAAAPRSTMR